MKKLLITLAALIASMTFMPPVVLAETTRLNPKDNEQNHNKPRKPVLSPVFCDRENNCLTIYADYTMLGDIQVVESETGIVVAEETGELSEGVMIELPEDCNSVTVYVIVNNKLFWAEL